MPDNHLQQRVHTQASVEPVQTELDDLNRPDPVAPGSTLQAQIAAAVAGQRGSSRGITTPISPDTPTPLNVPREPEVGRVRQEVAQNIEQVRLDSIRTVQGRVVAEIMGNGSLGEDVVLNAASVGTRAPSTIGKIGTSLPQVRESCWSRCIAKKIDRLFISS